MKGVLYDTGALLAAERSERRMWALHQRCLARGLVPVVPSVVLAQAWRGGPQARLSQLLHGCEVEPLTEPRARAAGDLCARAATRDVVDAAVMTSAADHGDAVVTRDPADLRHLATCLGRNIDLIAI